MEVLEKMQEINDKMKSLSTILREGKISKKEGKDRYEKILSYMSNNSQ